MAGKSAGGGGGSRAIKAGRAFVQLFADDTQLIRSLKSAEKRIHSWAGTTAKIGGMTGAAGGAVLAPITKLFSDAVSRGSDLDKLAKRFSTTTESVSVLATGFERAGVSMEGFEGFLDGMASKITEAANANQPLIENLDSMRQKLDPNVMMRQKPDQWIDTIAEAIQRTTSDLDKLQLADRFGVKELLPWLKKGTAGVNELRQIGLKGLVTTQQGEQAKQIMDAYTEGLLSVKMMLLEVGMALFPTAGGISELSGKIREGTATATKWIRDNKDLIKSITLISIGVVAAGAALVAFAPIIGAAGTAIGVLTTVLTTCLGVVGILFSPAGILIAGAAAAGVAFATLTDNGKASFSALSDGSDNMKTNFTEAWEGIMSALKSGDMEGAMKIATAGIEYLWDSLMLNMETAWVKLKEGTVDKSNSLMDKAIMGWVMAFSEAAGALGSEETRAAGWDFIKHFETAAGDTKAEIDAEREKRLNELKAKLEKSKEEFKATVKEAKEKSEREPASNLRGPGFHLGPYSKILAGIDTSDRLGDAKANLRAATRLYDAQKGTFGGPIAMQLGYGDNVAKRQLDAQEAIAKDARVLPQINGKLGDFINAQRFK